MSGSMDMSYWDICTQQRRNVYTPVSEVAGEATSDQSTQGGSEVLNQPQPSAQPIPQTPASSVESSERQLYQHRHPMASVSVDYAVSFLSFCETPLLGVDYLQRSTVLMILGRKGVILAIIPQNPLTSRLHKALEGVGDVYGRNVSCFAQAKTMGWLLSPAYEARPDWHRDFKLAMIRRELGFHLKRKFYDYQPLHMWALSQTPVLLLDTTQGGLVTIQVNGVDVTDEWTQEWPDYKESQPEELDGD
ncbi:hypothetical protein LOZ53_003693 [Ophidiomyces ophidiicola]|nr:hypothetical protein LOZ55_004499 [Ophidiomyces ophidiicola]KAI1977947.1 hypothetical protein LOZ54_006389 [Ophidiomyces ophidiicola]KAI1989112.1 hypothetical protein LOZ53_003693 [Ophidiomyces ophidiicola]KAI2002962.1 hypothetical protein LOZ51_000034 [Ophidiomyces ophidiicola]